MPQKTAFDTSRRRPFQILNRIRRHVPLGSVRVPDGPDRAFIAARAVNRGRDKCPGKGYFDLARALSCGPRAGESESDSHARELRLLNETMTK